MTSTAINFENRNGYVEYTWNEKVEHDKYTITGRVKGCDNSKDNLIVKKLNSQEGFTIDENIEILHYRILDSLSKPKRRKNKKEKVSLKDSTFFKVFEKCTVL